MKTKLIKFPSSTIMLGVTLLAVSTVASCGMRRGGGGQEKIDENKFQLYIHNFNGGYGSEWLDNNKKEYEELHKNDVYDGKTGVQVVVDGDKSVIDPAQIPAKDYDIYFGEQCQYAYFKYLGYIEDISDAVNEVNPYDGKKLADKLDDTQKTYYGYDDNNDGVKEYYGLPHYSGTYGFMYNADLFAKKGFYYVKDHPAVESNPNSADCFGRKTRELEKGPDGVYGTSDDGLPETFAEFYFLCDYIQSQGTAPIVWNGPNAKDYTAQILSCLVASLEGAEQYQLDYSFSGTKNNLVKLDGSGKIMKDSNGNPVTESVVLQQDVNGKSKNGYEVTRDLSRLNALEFLKKVVTTEKWQYADNFNTSFTNTMAQNVFVGGTKDNYQKDCAILLDGTWWQNEASTKFDYMEANYGTDGSETALKRDFGMMPFPKAKATDTHHNTYLEVLNSLQFVKKQSNPTKKALAIDFLQFINSDEQLRKFTTTTFTTRSLSYELTTEDLAKMSKFGKALYEYKNDPSTTIVYPFDRNDVYINNQVEFEPCHYFKATVDGAPQDYPCEKLRKTTTAESYFEQSYKYYSGLACWSR